METLVLKKEWLVKCKNCGHDSHCNERFIKDLDEMKNVEICRHCRCEACNEN